MLVGETNSSEASSFLSALISVEVLFSSVGWILLLALLQILIVIFRKRLIKIYVFLVTILELASLKKRLMAILRMTAAMPATSASSAWLSSSLPSAPPGTTRRLTIS